MQSGKKKSGPVEVMDFKGVKIPIYSGEHHGRRSYLIAYYAEGKRIRERAGTLEAARELAKEKIKSLTTGAAHVATFSPRDVAVIAEALELLKPVGTPLSQVAREYAEAAKILDGKATIVDAAKLYIRHAASQKLPVRTVPQVVEEFKAYIKSTGLSAKYDRDCKNRFKRASKAFPSAILNVQSDDIEKWLSSKDVSARTYNNNRNALVTLFRFARRKGYLPRAQETAAELVSKRKEVRGDIAIMTPDEFSLALSLAPDAFIPLLAIGGLAGLRTAEIARLEWQNIDFASSNIIVSSAKSKTASRRIVPMCQALVDWLTPCRKKQGSIMGSPNPEALMNRWARAKARYYKDKDGKNLVEIPDNGLRHSFGSYRLAIVEDAAKVSLEMGNSPRMIFEHYRQLATRAQAEKWFSVSPAGVLPIPVGKVA